MKDSAITRQRVLRKSFREQDKRLATRAVWRAVKEAAREVMMRDGFVEWSLVVAEFEDDEEGAFRSDWSDGEIK